jgi:hypothetical protein
LKSCLHCLLALFCLKCISEASWTLVELVAAFGSLNAFSFEGFYRISCNFRTVNRFVFKLSWFACLFWLAKRILAFLLILLCFARLWVFGSLGIIVFWIMRQLRTLGGSFLLIVAFLRLVRSKCYFFAFGVFVCGFCLFCWVKGF